MDAFREECCVCLRRTRRRTPCQHPLCSYCFRRLRRRECPYCRAELVVTVQEIHQRPTPLSKQDVELLRNCDGLEELHEAALALSGKLTTSSPSDRQNVQNTVAKRCCCFTRMGWKSQLEASCAARVMSGLVEDGLLVPSQSLQSALIDAMLGLCAGRQTPRPGSAVRRPASASQCRGKNQAPRSLPAWLEKVGLLATFAGARLIADGGAIAGLLVDELRRCLPDLGSQQLLAFAEPLARGAVLLTQADEGGSAASALRHVVSEALSRLESLEGARSVAELKSAMQALGLTPCELETAPRLPVRPAAESGRRRPKSASGVGSSRWHRPSPLSARICST
mmetsp:Transcript_402/g.1116  ORF Transcript_402/g.1116 Transcript_402/m.1116 type:complete len:338 (-) Transcript_402:18-1031(-)